MNNQEAAEMIRDDMKLHHDYLSGTYRKALNMAISALQAQEAKHSAESSITQNALDTISRQAAIALANSLKDDLPDDERIADAVMAHNEGIMEYQTKLSLLPSAQPEPHWIPCSERLPENYGNYLISIHGEEPDIGTINPNDKRGWSLCDANGFHWASDKKLIVTAWMPLPEQYRAEMRTDDTD